MEKNGHGMCLKISVIGKSIIYRSADAEHQHMVFLDLHFARTSSMLCFIFFLEGKVDLYPMATSEMYSINFVKSGL